MGCRLVQGFRYGRPLQGTEFDRFLMSRRSVDEPRSVLG
jgi:EAL domain-containing protein (putative c-di-GMP-specific phosphodiesterase class I)